MVDYAMCEGTKCPLKETCYRFRACPDKYMQTWMEKVPYDFEKQQCTYYWPEGR